MLSDTHLEVLCMKMDIPLVGIFFKDELPRKIEFNKGYIINIEDSVTGEGLQNDGTHWTCMFIKKYQDGTIEPIYFDSFGSPPPEAVKKFVKNTTSKFLPNTTKDIQSLINNACGWYCCAFLYAITNPLMASGELYHDIDNFLQMFEDLTSSHEYKKNEFILKQFFRSSDPTLRNEINIDDTESNHDGHERFCIDTALM
jgi:hypothetical protein